MASQRIIITGVSESGKSSLADSLIKNIDVPVYIRDPVGAPWSRCNATFETQDQLRAILEKEKPDACVCLIDEAADFFTVGDKANHWIFTRGRHHAMLPIAICHRVKSMAPIVRDQATDLYVFESSIETAQILADAYNQPDLECAPELRAGEYFHVHKDENGNRVCDARALW